MKDEKKFGNEKRKVSAEWAPKCLNAEEKISQTFLIILSLWTKYGFITMTHKLKNNLNTDGTLASGFWDLLDFLKQVEVSRKHIIELLNLWTTPLSIKITRLRI